MGNSPILIEAMEEPLLLFLRSDSQFEVGATTCIRNEGKWRESHDPSVDAVGRSELIPKMQVKIAVRLFVALEPEGTCSSKCADYGDSMGGRSDLRQQDTHGLYVLHLGKKPNRLAYLFDRGALDSGVGSHNVCPAKGVCVDSGETSEHASCLAAYVPIALRESVDLADTAIGGVGAIDEIAYAVVIPIWRREISEAISLVGLNLAKICRDFVISIGEVDDSWWYKHVACPALRYSLGVLADVWFNPEEWPLGPQHTCGKS